MPSPPIVDTTHQAISVKFQSVDQFFLVPTDYTERSPGVMFLDLNRLYPNDFPPPENTRPLIKFIERLIVGCLNIEPIAVNSPLGRSPPVRRTVRVRLGPRVRYHRSALISICLWVSMFAWLKKTSGPPTASDAMARAIILKCLFVKALAAPPPKYLSECRERWTKEEWKRFLEQERVQHKPFAERLREGGLWNVVEQKERSFLEMSSNEVTQQMLIDASWSVESIVCLLWALGHISELLPYDQQADPELTNNLPAGPARILIKKAVLRPHALIEKQRDLAELWHWRSRTRQLQESNYKFTFPGDMTIQKVIGMTSAKAATDGVIPSPIGDDFPAFGKAYRDLTQVEYSQATSIAMERHRALNWLCGLAPGNRWSETPTGT